MSDLPINGPLKVLVLEDNPRDAELMIRELRRAGFDPLWSRVEIEAEYLAALQDPPDVILADYTLPHFDGLRALKQLQELGLDIPFILVSATVGEEIAVEVMRQGATDFLLKDRLARLGSAVEQALITRRLREESRQAAKYREATRRVLQVLNESGGLQQALTETLAVLKDCTGVDALGVRLRVGDDYPYVAQLGFSEEFLRTENSLLAQGCDGEVVRDADGIARLQCGCGPIIAGSSTVKGSGDAPEGAFWINDSSLLLELPPDEDTRLPTRDSCVRQGYASIGLVPIRRDHEVVGLIHLNARRKGAFNGALMEFLEHIASHIGNAVGREKAEEALRTLVAEKEALLKEVHHRVKNNLQVINSLLRLEAGHRPHPDTKAALREMQGRIQSMALLHETLYRSGNFASVDLAIYLGQLATQWFHTFVSRSGSVRLELDLTPLRVDLDRAIPFGLLVNELVSNALKHGFPDGRCGTVRVEMVAVNDGPEWRLSVSDDGVGLPAGFPGQSPDTLGLQLVSDLTRQVGGELRLEPSPGATFTVTFRPDEPKGFWTSTRDLTLAAGCAPSDALL